MSDTLPDDPVITQVMEAAEMRHAAQRQQERQDLLTKLGALVGDNDTHADERRRAVRKAAGWSGGIIGIIATVVTSLVGFGEQRATEAAEAKAEAEAAEGRETEVSTTLEAHSARIEKVEAGQRTLAGEVVKAKVERFESYDSLAKKMDMIGGKKVKAVKPPPSMVKARAEVEDIKRDAKLQKAAEESGLKELLEAPTK